MQKRQLLVTFIPKFHLPAHVRECQWKYSFNYIKVVPALMVRLPNEAGPLSMLWHQVPKRWGQVTV
ncbi:hypothetical protein L210DRAFT_845871 [Boletus edulis BED1]|uniref:Uncharacterized protein n=1 Tax=Boletus edulis BED1 TaxID=1328754 RepID=A0AAD4BUR6_BOLED|nr:hypothetical protein L210DRAFT_845871 [Boletus edulis BED1]